MRPARIPAPGTVDSTNYCEGGHFCLPGWIAAVAGSLSATLSRLILSEFEGSCSFPPYPSPPRSPPRSLSPPIFSPRSRGLRMVARRPTCDCGTSAYLAPGLVSARLPLPLFLLVLVSVSVSVSVTTPVLGAALRRHIRYSDLQGTVQRLLPPASSCSRSLAPRHHALASGCLPAQRARGECARGGKERLRQQPSPPDPCASASLSLTHTHTLSLSLSHT